jgi:microcin C transport system substrate-binding protein
VTLTAPRLVRAAEVEAHGLSIFGDLRYPPDFRHFDYVNPNAPKGGSFSHEIASIEGNQNLATFNTLNIYVLKGDGAAGMPLTFASLMTRALDEPDAVYGYAARAVRVSDDGLTYRFLIRPEARFHDGSKLTARDAAFSINILKAKGHPRISQTLLSDRRRSRRRRSRTGKFRQGAQPRSPAAGLDAADLLGRLLRRA